MSQHIRACPFCGKTETYMLKPDCSRTDPKDVGTRAFPYMVCRQCHASVSGQNYDQSGKTAIEAWNTRPLEDDASSLIETLESTITTLYGERCSDTEPGCPICDAWGFVDRLKEDTVE